MAVATTTVILILGMKIDFVRKYWRPETTPRAADAVSDSSVNAMMDGTNQTVATVDDLGMLTNV